MTEYLVLILFILLFVLAYFLAYNIKRVDELEDTLNSIEIANDLEEEDSQEAILTRILQKDVFNA
jgi:hypothetical protein